MELLVFGHAGAKVLVFPTRCARFHEYEDIGLIGALHDKIEQGQLQLYCVDSLDQESFYCFWSRPGDRLHRHLQYEAYLLHEVLPLMWNKNRHPSVIAHGCSFGRTVIIYCPDSRTTVPNWTPFPTPSSW